jgi:hypothetical protein
MYHFFVQYVNIARNYDTIVTCPEDTQDSSPSPKKRWTASQHFLANVYTNGRRPYTKLAGLSHLLATPSSPPAPVQLLRRGWIVIQIRTSTLPSQFLPPSTVPTQRAISALLLSLPEFLRTSKTCYASLPPKLASTATECPPATRTLKPMKR